MKVLVTGAAGYIGSVVTELLNAHGHTVVALDNLAAGHRDAVDPAASFVEVDLLDAPRLRDAVARARVDAVVHLAAEAAIERSLHDPGRFFMVNVAGGLNLHEAMAAAQVRRLVFSSTAAVYGEPRRIPIDEDDPHVPVNPYGESKLLFERVLPWYAKVHGLQHVSLRYFNACGATERCGEFHRPETHLVAVLLEVALGRREAIHLFGTDYDTPDGTCIRDYVHVADIAQAHLLALAKIDALTGRAFNLGSGRGRTNREVIETVRAVTGRPVRVIEAPRRPGDPARLVASPERIRRELGWRAQYPELAAMVETAWRWRLRHPEGYAS